MTVHCCGAALGFLAFGLSLLIGLYVGNSFITVVLRSIIAMIAAYVLGVVLAGLGQRAVMENLETEAARLREQAVAALPDQPAPVESIDESAARQTAAQPPPVGAPGGVVAAPS